jgi:hypothetical protein
MLKFKGLDTLARGVSSAYKKQMAAVRDGLLEAGLLLQAYSMEECPVQFGILRGSSYVKMVDNGTVQVGYTASYAIYVHEDLDALHGQKFNDFYAAEIEAGKMKSRGPGQKAKYLEDPAREHLSEYRDIIFGASARGLF